MKRRIKGDGLIVQGENGESVIELTEKMGENGNCIVFLKGNISNEAAYDVGDELLALLSVGRGLILDMSDLNYLSNAFADILVRLQARMEQTEYESMPIQNMTDSIYRYLSEQGCIASLDYVMKEE